MTTPIKLMNFSEFFESYQLSDTDSPQLTTDKKRANEIQALLDEYSSKRAPVQNAYMSAKDEKDLKNKLYSLKVLGDEGEIKNPLLSIWATYCAKQKSLSDMENKIKDESTNKEFDIADARAAANKLRAELNKDKGSAEKKMVEMKKDLEEIKKRIATAFSNPAATE